MGNIFNAQINDIGKHNESKQTRYNIKLKILLMKLTK